jgi:Na+-driven multidrug efflux pump
VSYGFLGIVNLTAASFNGIKKPMQAAGVAALRLFGLLIPLGFVGRELFGLIGLFGGVALGNIFSGLSGYLWFLKNYRSAPDLTRAEASGDRLRTAETDAGGR